MRADTLIVGGGVMGTSIAMHVARRSDPLSQPVLLLERGELAAGSSGRSGAILRQHYTDRQLAGMARDSLREYAGFEGRTGYSVGFQPCGVLTLAGPEAPATLELVRANVAMQRAIGIETELIDAERIRALAPNIVVSDDALAAFEPTAGVCDPRRTVESFAKLARYYGATTRCGAEVTEVLVDAGRVRGVRVGDETIEARKVVLAAGPWSRRLFERLGIDVPLRVLAPEQHFVETPEVGGPPRSMPEPPSDELSELDARFAAPREDDAHAHPVILDLEAGHYARCEPGEARTRVGRMDYAQCRRLEDPGELGADVSESFSRWAREALVRRLPAYAGQAGRGGLLGWYTVTPDAQPLLGTWPGIEGLFLIAGFSGHGFKLAPSIGLGLTQMLFDEPVSAFEPGFFDPCRFGEGPTEWGGRFGL